MAYDEWNDNDDWGDFEGYESQYDQADRWEDYSGSSDWDWVSDVGDWYKENKEWVAPAAKSLYGAYRADKAGDEYRAQQQPLQDYYNKMLPRFEEYYDPANVKAGIGKEFGRRSGMLSDIWREADQPREAAYVSRGMDRSSTAARERAASDVRRSKYLMENVLPESEQAYYNAPTQMMNQMRGTTGMMGAQPNMQQMYQSSQKNPYQDALDRYLVSVL